MSSSKHPDSSSRFERSPPFMNSITMYKYFYELNVYTPLAIRSVFKSFNIFFSFITVSWQFFYFIFSISRTLIANMSFVFFFLDKITFPKAPDANDLRSIKSLIETFLSTLLRLSRLQDSLSDGRMTWRELNLISLRGKIIED